MDERAVAVIADCPHFAALDRPDAETLANASKIVEVDRDKLIFSREDAPDAVYVVETGQIAVEILSSRGRSIRVATLGRGQVFGEIAVLDNGRRTAHARAIGKARLLRIAKADYLALISRSPAFALSIIRELTSKLRGADNQVEAIAFQTLRERVAGAICDLAAANGTDTLAITQAELAERLSATREKVNLHLRGLQEAGLIKIARKRIDIVQPEALAAIAGGG